MTLHRSGAKMRNLIPVFALAIVAPSCAPEGPQSGAVPGGTIVISAAADADALVPPLIIQISGRQVADQIFDRLADIGDSLNTVGDGGFRPALAERWTWAPDSLSIVFYLNPRARWHDGGRVSAEDVRFSYALYRDRAVASPVASLLGNIDSVTVRDSSSAVFWFAARNPRQFFDATYHMLIQPRHVLDTVPRARLRESSFARAPVGSGRFRFWRWTPAVSVEIVADTGNYRGRANLDRVIWTVAPEFNTAATRFLSGEADVFEFLRPEHIADIARSTERRVVVYPALDYGFVQFNLREARYSRRPHRLFWDRALRTAVSMAIDRESLVRNVFDTLALVSIGPTSRASPFADPSVRPLPFDTARSARMLESLGWRDQNGDGMRERNGRPLEFSLLVPSSSRNRVRMAVLLQEQLRRAGVGLRIEQLEQGAFIERARSGRFDAVFGAWHMEAGPAGIRQTWGTAGARSANGLNFGSYESRVFDAHVDSALAANDRSTARSHYRRAIETAIADAPAIWLYEPRATLGLHRRIRPAALRADAWWARLADWSIEPGERLPRDRLGIPSEAR
jgi:peptide/nickel transport system substrate-binding protein